MKHGQYLCSNLRYSILPFALVVLGACSNTPNTATEQVNLESQKKSNFKNSLSPELLCPVMERICDDMTPAKLEFKNKTCRMTCPGDDPLE